MAENVALPDFEGKIGGITASDSGTNTYTGPDFKVSGIFSSHMVLQRRRPIIIWGFSSAPGSVVSGEFDGEKYSTFVNSDNRWTLVFSEHEACSSPMTMTVSDDRENTVTFDDILIGDVWLVGGQSNAELNLRPCIPYTPGIEFDGNANFRLFRQTQAYSWEHKEFQSEPQSDIINPDWCWKRPDEEASAEFSAMGWFFAREITKQLDVPMGMVMMCAGGACVRELVPVELAHATGYFDGANVPVGGYFNTLIAPLIGLQFKGQLFFQGESEAIWRSCSDVYDRDLALLVYDERIRFGIDFPFYNVQLCNYPNDGPNFFPNTDLVRVKQYDAFRIIKDYALVPDYDLPSDDDYGDWPHSPHKEELGRRLAALVLAREYGIGSEEDANAPMPVSAVISADGSICTVTFANVGSGLKTLDDTDIVRGFTFGGTDNRTPAQARITAPDKVEVSIPENADSSLIGYAFSTVLNRDIVNLTDSSGLPALAFLIPTSKQ